MVTYTNKLFPNKEHAFPPPPEWLVWYQYGWGHDLDTGNIRHMASLQKCKRMVSPYGSDPNIAFRGDWAIYRWDGDRYKLCYSGKRDELKKDNELFKKRVKPTTPVREVPQDEIEAALASISEAFHA